LIAPFGHETCFEEGKTLFQVALMRMEEDMMKVKPLGDRIVVRRQTAAETTAGGIVLPDSAKNKPQRGTIVAVGPGRLLKDGSRRPLQIKEGDKVLFTSWAGDEFRQRGSDEILLMREEDVLAVIDE